MSFFFSNLGFRNNRMFFFFQFVQVQQDHDLEIVHEKTKQLYTLFKKRKLWTANFVNIYAHTYTMYTYLVHTDVSRQKTNVSRQKTKNILKQNKIHGRLLSTRLMTMIWFLFIYFIIINEQERFLVFSTFFITVIL